MLPLGPVVGRGIVVLLSSGLSFGPDAVFLSVILVILFQVLLVIHKLIAESPQPDFPKQRQLRNHEHIPAKNLGTVIGDLRIRSRPEKLRDIIRKSIIIGKKEGKLDG